MINTGKRTDGCTLTGNYKGSKTLYFDIVPKGTSSNRTTKR